MTSQLYVKKAPFLPDQYDVLLAIGLSAHICMTSGATLSLKTLARGNPPPGSPLPSAGFAKTRADEPNSKSCFF
jgi:hypothetical protein